MLACEVSNLTRLLVDSFLGVGEVVVDELLVAGIDQGAEVSDGSADEAEAPEGHDIDEVIGEERGGAGGKSVGHVLGEQDALELDDEEVQQLLDVFERGFEGFAGDGVIALGTEAGGEALRNDKFASDFDNDDSWTTMSV